MKNIGDPGDCHGGPSHSDPHLDEDDFDADMGEVQPQAGASSRPRNNKVVLLIPS